MTPFARRRLLALGLGAIAAGAARATLAKPGMTTRPIPKTGERIPCVGLGTWQTFDVGSDASERRAVTCPIPATSKPKHLADNVRAGFGPLPDTAARRKMVQLLET